MHLPKFEYHRPSKLEEALDLLKNFGAGAKVLAGGTELLPSMKYGLKHPDVLISLMGIPLYPLLDSPGDEILSVNALSTLTTVRLSRLINEKAPLLAEAAGRVASQEIRNMATLGGNICQDCRCLYYNQTHSVQFIEPCFKRGGTFCYFLPKSKKCIAVYSSDIAPALICLDAEIMISSHKGQRRVQLMDLYTEQAHQHLRLDRDEVITYVLVPITAGSWGWSYRKFSSRGGLEFAALTIAVRVEVDHNNKTFKQGRIVVGSVSNRPESASKAELLLQGGKISEYLIREISRVTADEIPIVPHHGYARGYLKQILEIETNRALLAAIEKA